MKNLLVSIFTLFLCLNLTGQNLWNNSDLSRTTSPRKHRVSHPSEFRTVSFELSTFLNQVREAPLRSAADAMESEVIVSFPLPNGKNTAFRLVDAELMHPELAAKFPELKAWIGKGIDDPTADLRISYSPYHGLNGMIQSGKHATVYIDPLTEDHKLYMVYDRDHVTKLDEGFQCHTEGADGHGKQRVTADDTERRYGDCNLRRYRLAQSCTGEYAQYHIGQAGGSTGNTANDKAIVQSAMNVTMTRVNGVFEKDLGITMQFIANNDAVIYLNGNTDPWTNEYNTTTAQTLDAQVGVNSYDIGHNFNTTGGGSAGCLTCVCTSDSQTGTHKGRGYTGRAAPIGDPFDIDYVAHEMGHQFGGYHTQSNDGCRSGSGATEVEPGSGSTIMGYAGICAANVQNQSDDYFHYVNIRDIVDAINNGVENTCAELIPSGNTAPVADAGSDYTIPVSTAFVLEGTGSDANDANLTYTWEQNDPEAPGGNIAPPSNRTVGPMFRSFDPVTVPYRYFPNMNEIVAGNLSPTWEMIPTVSRTMDFAFTVRDNNLNSGCTALDEMTVTTDAGSGPFLVTAPNTNVTWNAGDTETVTWDVAGTNNAPVNCANVDIILSTDGGQTYPYVIASNVPNDGSQSITVPGSSGTNNRIMIRCSDNIFFDISNQNFSINQVGAVVNFSSSAAGTVDEGTSCNGKIISFELVMDSAPTANTTVDLGFSGTATQGLDYDLNATSFVFTPSNWSNPKTVVIKINEDGEIEDSENIVVEIASVSGGGAVKGLNGLLTFHIIEDDKDPFTSGTPIVTTILSEDFEGAFPAGWTRTGSPQVFATGTAASLSSGFWTIPTTNSSQILASNDDDCNCDMSNEVLKSAPFTVGSNMPEISLLMDLYYISGSYQGNNESAVVELSKDGGATFPISIALSGAAQWQNLNIDLSSYLPVSGTESWVLRWVYNDGPGWTYGCAIDNISVEVTEPGAAEIQTNVNIGTGYAEQSLGAGEIVHFFDQVTGKIMCTIDNSASSHDYGCTRVDVDREGTASVGFANSGSNTFLHSKAFKVRPTNNTTSDVGYTIYLYYTDAEVAGWEGATLESRNSAYIHKVDGNNKIGAVTEGNPLNIPITSQSATYSTFGNNHVYSATFTNGFSGFGVGIQGSQLPVELLYFKGRHVEKLGNRLDWVTVSEENTDRFEVQRSNNAHDFEKIGEVAANGNSTENISYKFFDGTPKRGVNYYRLKMIDTDGTFEYSNVVAIRAEGLDFGARPNPTTGNVTLSFDIPLREAANIQVMDMSGKVISSEFKMPDSNNEILMDINDLPTGAYFIRVITDSGIVGKKIIKS